MSLSLVQGGLVVAEMAISADAAHPCPNGCDGCGNSDLDAGACLSLCGMAAHGLVQDEPVALSPASQASFQGGYLALDGRSHSPDPGPPRPLTLG